MKKIFQFISVILLIISLAACSANNEAQWLDYPTGSTSKYIAEAQPLDEIIFSTTGEENGLIGTIFTFEGEVVGNGEVSGANYVVVSTEYGDLSVGDMYGYLKSQMPESYFDTIILEIGADYSMPQKAENVKITATYAGYSEVLKMPSLYLGANKFIVESFRDDDAEIETRPVESTTTGAPDFFSDKERQSTYKELYISYQYANLLNYLNEYISEHSPSDADSVYKILKFVEPAAEAVQNCTVVYDEFDNDYSVNYNGNTGIDASTCVYGEVSGTYIKVTLGFVKSDWLFFDKTTIKFSDDDKDTSLYNSYNIQRDTIGGGNIKESVFITPSDKETDKYKTDKDITIRFENRETNETFDHTLTQTEKNAVATMGILYRAYRNCSDLQYNWNVNNP